MEVGLTLTQGVDSVVYRLLALLKLSDVLLALGLLVVVTMLVGLLVELECLLGRLVTLLGHKPRLVDNAIAHTAKARLGLLALAVDAEL